MLAFSTLALTAAVVSGAFTDHFDDNVRDTAVWTSSSARGATTSETGGQLRVVAPANIAEPIAQYDTLPRYDLREHFAAVQVAQKGSSSTSRWYLQFAARLDTATYASIVVSDGRVSVQRKLASDTLPQVVATYSLSSTLNWVRIRDSGGVTYWEWSTTGVSWGILHQEASPFAMSSVRFVLAGGLNGTSSSSETLAYDNFVYTPVSAAVAKVAFTSPPRTFVRTACGGAATAVTLQRQDASGKPVMAPSGGHTVTLTSSAGSTGAFFEDAACSQPAVDGVFTLQPGATGLSAYYVDNAAGTPTLTVANSAGLTNPAGQTQTVANAAAGQLAFSSGSHNFVAGACSGAAKAIDVHLQSTSGVDTPAGPGGVSFTMSSSSSAGTFFLDAGCLSPAPGNVFTIPAGADFTNVYYVDTLASTPSIGLSNSAGLTNPGNQAHVVVANIATQVVFESASKVLTAGLCTGASGGGGVVRVRVKDAYGNTTSTPSAVTLTPTTSHAGTGTFHTTNTCATAAVTSFTIAAGTNTIAIHYRDTLAGDFNVALGVSGAGLAAPAPQANTVVAAAPSRLLFNSSARTFVAGHCGGASRSVRMLLQDTFGNAAPPTSAATPFTCTSSSNTGTWFIDETCTTPAQASDFGFEPGVSSREFFYRDASPGTPTFTLATTATGFTNIDAPQTQSVVPLAPGRVMTLPATGIESDRVTLHGEAIPDGTETIACFEFHRTPPTNCGSGTNGTQHPSSAISLGEGLEVKTFLHTVLGLEPNTKYYYCARAENSGGVVAGEVESFTTPSVVPGGADAATSSFAFDEGENPRLETFNGRLHARLTLRDARGLATILGPADALEVTGDAPLSVSAPTLEASSGSHIVRVSLPSCPATPTALQVRARVNGQAVGSGLTLTPVCVEAPTRVGLEVALSEDTARSGHAVDVGLQLTDTRGVRSTALYLVVDTRGLRLGDLQTTDGTPLGRERRIRIDPSLFDGDSVTLSLHGIVLAAPGEIVTVETWLEDEEGVAVSEHHAERHEVSAMQMGFGCSASTGTMSSVLAGVALFGLALRRKAARHAKVRASARDR